MSSPATIMARVRSCGANVVLNGDRLRIVNGAKLPPAAPGVIQANREALAAYLRQEADAVEERAAIIQFDGRAPREWAEQFAEILIRSRPAGISDLNWSWFITCCGRMIDEAPEMEAA